MVFNIGIFPFMTIAATLILFDPNWPRQFFRFLQSRFKLLEGRNLERSTRSPSVVESGQTATRLIILAFVASWLVVQIAVPLRHHFRPGNVAWNEDGHRFSWRMKLRSKRGTAQFYLRYDDGSLLDVNVHDHLTRKQANKMACIPDLIWQFAQFVEEEYRRSDVDDPAVYVITRCSLNTRESVPLVSELVDLTSIPRTEPTNNWLLPNSKSLPSRIF